MSERIVRVGVPVPAGAGDGKGNAASTVSLTTKTTKGGASGGAEGSEGAEPVIQYVSVKTTLAIFNENFVQNEGMLLGGVWGGKTLLAQCKSSDDVIDSELAMGVYSLDGKDAAKTPLPTCARVSNSREFFVVGTNDGTVTIRPSKFPKVFVRFVGHNGSCGGVSAASMSFDDNYVLSTGRDGLFSVHRIRRDITEQVAKSLQFDLEAEIFEKTTKDYDPKEPEPLYMTIVYNQDYRNEWQQFQHTPSRAKQLADDGGITKGDLEAEEPEPSSISLGPEIVPVKEEDAVIEPEPAPVPEEPPVEVVVEVAVPVPAVGVADSDATPAIAAVALTSAPGLPLPSTKGQAGVDVEAREIPEGAYSIEDAKKKSEEDAKRVAAEELKEKVRQQVAQLQVAYNEARAMNEALPVEVRLGFDLMAVDGEYLDMLHQEGNARLDEVHKECAYEAEKAEMLRRKVTNRLMDGMLVLEIPMSGFDTTISGVDGRSTSLVKSLRCRGLHPSVKSILDDLRATLANEELARARSKAREAKNDPDSGKAATESKTADDAAKEITDTASVVGSIVEAPSVASLNMSKSNQLDMGEKKSGMSRREMRKLRMDSLSKHNSKKPSENDDDPRDLTAIRIAEKTIGDYKLKIADDYEISEENRVNASKKRGQMALLEESMVTMRLQFNERFLSLRELKRQIIYAIKRDNNRVREIDAELGQAHLSMALWQPELDPREFPDDADEVTPQELEIFKGTRAHNSWAKSAPPPHSIITGEKTKVVKNDQLTNGYQTVYNCQQKDLFQGKDLTTNDNFLADPTVMTVVPSRSDEQKFYEVQDNVLAIFAAGKSREEAKQITLLDELLPVLRIARKALKLKQQEEEEPVLTDKQKAKVGERRKLLDFERSMLMKKTESNIQGFEEAMDVLRVDRHQVLADLKLAELKMLCLYQEYKQLQTFEAKDLALQQRQKRCEGEKHEITTSMTDQKANMDLRVEEMKQWTEKLAAVTTDLKASLPDSNPFAETLNKIYKKKIKRSKSGADGDEDEEEEDEEDGDDDDEEEEVKDIPVQQALLTHTPY